jgi:hypothetical protein
VGDMERPSAAAAATAADEIGEETCDVFSGDSEKRAPRYEELSTWGLIGGDGPPLIDARSGFDCTASAGAAAGGLGVTLDICRCPS